MSESLYLSQLLKILLIFTIVRLEFCSACKVLPWEQWGTCTGSCGHQQQSRIRRFILECNRTKGTPATECMKICHLTDVPWNNTRPCIQCSPEEWSRYLKNLKLNSSCAKKPEVDCSSIRNALYIMIPMIAAGLLIGSCMTYLCLRKKKRKETKRRWNRIVDDGILRRGSVDSIPPDRKRARINSIDVKGLSWGQW